MSTPTRSVKKNSKKTETEAAKKIINFFKKYQTKCSIKPLSIADNIYICFNKKGEEIPLVNFFRFSKKDKIIKPEHFIKLYNYIKIFDVKTGGLDRLIFKIKLAYDDKNILLISADKVIKNKMDENPELETLILKFIYYNLINNIDLDLSEGVSFFINHPKNFSEFTAGIHKDRSIYTCITSINSPVSTEIAFDTDAIKLEWLKCSPLFRFNTSGEITTLCFSDKYILHTAPIYEEEGIDPSTKTLNNFNDNETMIEVKDPNDGKTYLKIGYYLDEDGDYLDDYLEIEPTETFLKQEHRKKIKKPETRQILASFFFKYDQFDETDQTFRDRVIEFQYSESFEISITELQQYKIDLVQEKIELTEDSSERIRTTESLGMFKLTGGKKKDIQNHPTVIMRSHLKRGKYDNDIPKEKYKNIIKGAYKTPKKYVSKKNNTRKIKKNYL